MPDQDLIETACHNAVRAMHDESATAYREQRSPETCLILAAALETMVREGVDSGFRLTACIDRLRRSASPRRAA